MRLCYLIARASSSLFRLGLRLVFGLVDRLFASYIVLYSSLWLGELTVTCDLGPSVVPIVDRPPSSQQLTIDALV